MSLTLCIVYAVIQRVHADHHDAIRTTTCSNAAPATSMFQTKTIPEETQPSSSLEGANWSQVLSLVLKKLPTQSTRAMWLWGGRDEISTPAGIRRVLGFASAPHGDAAQAINRILIEIPSASLSGADSEHVKDFITEAHYHDIVVELLAGAPGGSWALDAEKHIPKEICSAVVQYNRENRLARFDGIHFDIEPHTLPDGLWHENPSGIDGDDRYNSQVKNNYIEIMRFCKQTLARNDRSVTLSADLGTDYAYYVHGLWAALNEEQLLDYLGIMNYFNNLDQWLHGQNRQSDLDGAFYNLGRASMPVLVGVETIPPPHAPAEISFWSLGYQPLHTMLRQGMEAIVEAHQQRFGGICIHHYESYRRMVANGEGVDGNMDDVGADSASCSMTGGNIRISGISNDIQCVIFYSNHRAVQAVRPSSGIATMSGHPGGPANVELYRNFRSGAEIDCTGYVKGIDC